jgi:hypothetical protein
MVVTSPHRKDCERGEMWRCQVEKTNKYDISIFGRDVGNPNQGKLINTTFTC